MVHKLLTFYRVEKKLFQRCQDLIQIAAIDMYSIQYDAGLIKYSM